MVAGSKLPVWPWATDDFHMRGPVCLTGKYKTIDVCFNELGLGLSDMNDKVRMDLQQKFLTLFELERLAENDPFELGRVHLADVEGVF